MIPFVGFIRRRLRYVSPIATDIGAFAFGAGAICLSLAALIVSHPYRGNATFPRLHEILARSSAFALAAGMLVLGDRSLANRRLFGKLPEGAPDGLAVDAEGGVWVAATSTGELLRFRNDSTLDVKIKVSDRMVMSLAFGGADLCDLYLTTGIVPNTKEFTGSILRARTTVQVCRRLWLAFKTATGVTRTYKSTRFAGDGRWYYCPVSRLDTGSHPRLQSRWHACESEPEFQKWKFRLIPVSPISGGVGLDGKVHLR